MSTTSLACIRAFRSSRELNSVMLGEKLYHHELKSLNPPEVFIFFFVARASSSAVSASLIKIKIQNKKVKNEDPSISFPLPLRVLRISRASVFCSHAEVSDHPLTEL